MTEPANLRDPQDPTRRTRQGNTVTWPLWVAFAPAVLIPTFKHMTEGSPLTDQLCAAFAMIWSIVISVPLTRHVSPLPIRTVVGLAIAVGLTGINLGTAFFLGCLTGVERIRF